MLQTTTIFHLSDLNGQYAVQFDLIMKINFVVREVQIFLVSGPRSSGISLMLQHLAQQCALHHSVVFEDEQS